MTDTESSDDYHVQAEELVKFHSGLKIFVSFDLVGSTEYKQRYRKAHPSEDNKNTAHESLNKSCVAWAEPFVSLPKEVKKYSAIIWQSIIKEFKNSHEEELKFPQAEPQLWRFMGDEVILTLAMDDSDLPHTCLAILLYTKRMLADLRQDVYREKFGLEIKACIWMAGFPVTNLQLIAESTLNENLDNDIAGKNGIAEHLPLSVLQAMISVYENKKTYQDMTRLDFIGPSIDLGFRLSKYSSPRKIIMSADFVYLLLKAGLTHIKFESFFHD